MLKIIARLNFIHCHTFTSSYEDLATDNWYHNDLESRDITTNFGYVTNPNVVAAGAIAVQESEGNTTDETLRIIMNLRVVILGMKIQAMKAILKTKNLQMILTLSVHGIGTSLQAVSGREEEPH